MSDTPSGQVPAAEESALPPPDEVEGLLSLRWREPQDALQDGVTFFGSLEEGRYALYSRRMAGVPLRIALAQPMEFGSLAQLFGFALGEGVFRLGADRALAVGAETKSSGAITNGDYPIFREGVPADAPPVGFFRKKTSTSFEIEIPWQMAFAQVPTGRPLTPEA